MLWPFACFFCAVMRQNLVRIGGLCALALLVCFPASAGVSQIQVTSRTSFANGATFGSVGAYEVLQGTVYFTVNPSDPHNSVIFDITHAPLDSKGLVEFSANFFILKPVNMAKSNGEILYDVNNRGGKIVLQLMDDVPNSANINNPSTLTDVGNQFLLLQGYTIVWVGWEGDLVPGPDLLIAQLPVAMQNGQPITGSVITEFFDTTATTMPLSSSSIIQSYPAISTNQTTAGAQLVVRPSDSPRPSGPGIPAGTVIPNSQWSFSNCSTPSTTDICYPAGFQTDMVYQLIYTAQNSIIMGLGYATTRDFVSFLRYSTQDTLGNPNPLAGDISFALGFGASQSGRYMRDYLYQGFNQDEQNRRVFDGVFVHVAGANKLPLNFRFADANPYSVQHRQRFVPSDNFPRAYGVLTDPVTGTTDGILKRPASDPKVIHTITSTEYWEYRNSLVDTNDSGTTDIANPSNVAEYLLAGTAHLHSIDDIAVDGPCQQLINVNTNGGLLRALLVNLDQWVRNGSAPPPSAVPSIAGGTLVTSDQGSTGFPNIPGVTYNGLLNGSGEQNFGPDVTGNSGVIDSGFLDPIPLSTQQVLVPKVNSIGIDLGGVQEPTVAAPIATLTGWNLRAPASTDGDLCDLEGMTIALQTTLADRLAAGDSRPSLQELYGDHTGYVNAITASAQSLQSQRLLLSQDVTQFIQNASNSSVLVPAPPPILLSLTPSQVTVSGGTQVMETAKLSTVAPAGGAVVSLSTSDSTLLSVAPSVTVPAGSYSAAFTVNTTPVSSSTMATITGSYGGAAQNASITVLSPTAPFLSLNPTTVTGGTSSQGTVTLSSPAPSGGTVVTLSSSNPAVVSVPPTVTVAFNSTSATFTVNTNAVTTETTVTLSAMFGTATKTAILAVQAVGGGTQPSFIQGAANYGTGVNGISATFGTSVGSGHLLIAAVGYSGGSTNDANVTFTISDTLGNTWISAIGPFRWVTDKGGVAQIFYVANSSKGTDTITVTPSVGNANFLDVYIHEYSGLALNSPLDVTASNFGTGTTLSSGTATTTAPNELIFGYSLVANSAVAGAGFTARETLDGNVSEDEVVNASGSYSATFSQPAGGDWITLMATFKASSGGSSPSVSSLTLNPSTLVGGNPSQGTVTLSGPAPSGGATVTLSSSNTSVATVPASISIGSGGTSGTFAVTTNSVTAATQVTITASYNGTTTAILVVNGASGSQPIFVQGGANNGSNVNSISTAFPSSVGAGHLLVAAVGYSDSSTNIANVTFTVTDSLGNTWTSALSPVRRSGHGVAQIFYVKNSLAGTDTVTVTSSIGNASFLELYIHEYSGTNTSAPLDVTANGQGSGTTPSSGAATTTAANEVIFGYALLTHTGGAGSGFTARETLGGDVSEDEVVNASGSYSATFSQPAGGDWITLMATFKASSGGSSPSVSSLTLNPSTLVGGNPSQGTVTLSGPAPSGGATVTLSSSNTSVATVPASISIGSGGTSGTFAVTTNSVTAATQVTITASYNGTTTAILVVNGASGSQPIFVQGGANNGGNVNSISTAFPSSVGAGHLLVAAVGYSDSSTNIANVTFTVTDSLGNTWTSALSPVRRSGHGVAQIFYVKNSLAGTDTVTVTSSIGNASFLELYIHEYSGTNTSAPLDVTANGQGSGTTPSSGAATTTAANEVIFGYALLTHTGGAGSGFTARETLGGDVSEDEVVNASGSYSATFSQPASGHWITLMSTFK